eukprot:10177353-Heterocapsa_arctica.AAC.1
MAIASALSDGPVAPNMFIVGSDFDFDVRVRCRLSMSMFDSGYMFDLRKLPTPALPTGPGQGWG